MSNVIDLDRPTAAGTAIRDRSNRPGVRRAVYTVAEVSRLLSLSLGGTYELVRAGVIPGRKLGGRWVIPKRAFHTWLDTWAEEPDDNGNRP
jgi:excisionase family DNA binding protein